MTIYNFITTKVKQQTIGETVTLGIASLEDPSQVIEIDRKVDGLEEYVKCIIDTSTEYGAIVHSVEGMNREKLLALVA